MSCGQRERHMVKCEACNGKGKHWFAYNFDDRYRTECTQETWSILPETPEQAELTRGHFIRDLVETCEVCDGEGELEYEEDYEPEYDE